MIDVKVEWDREKGDDPHPLFKLTIEDKDAMHGYFVSDGLRISEIDEVMKKIYNKLKDARAHYRWIATK